LHPTAVAAIADYFQPGRTIDDLFRDCIELILR
jgi:TetR/AcrR family tetracycline transcriptional repressor